MPKGRKKNDVRAEVSAGASSEVAEGVQQHLRVLKSLIERRHWTYAAIQERLGWGKSAISRLMHGHHRLDFEHIGKILLVLGVTPEDYFRELYGDSSVEDGEILNLERLDKLTDAVRLAAMSSREELANVLWAIVRSDELSRLVASYRPDPYRFAKMASGDPVMCRLLMASAAGRQLIETGAQGLSSEALERLRRNLPTAASDPRETFELRDPYEPPEV